VNLLWLTLPPNGLIYGRRTHLEATPPKKAAPVEWVLGFLQGNSLTSSREARPLAGTVIAHGFLSAERNIMRRRDQSYNILLL